MSNQYTEETVKIIPIDYVRHESIPLELFNSAMSQTKNDLIGYLEVTKTSILSFHDLAQKFIPLYNQWANENQMILIKKHSPINFIFLNFLKSFVELTEEKEILKEQADFIHLFEKAYTDLKTLLDTLVISIDDYSSDYSIYDRIHSLFLSVLRVTEG